MLADVGDSATLALVNVSYADVFFVVCADAPTLELPPLPGLCTMPTDSASGSTTQQRLPLTTNASAAVPGQCLSPTHEPLSWKLDATFRFMSEDSRLFSWAVSTHVGSSVAISGAAPTSNFCVGLGDLGGTVSLSTRTGKASAIDGLVDRNVTVALGTEVLGWHLWCDKIQLSVLPGSRIGDLTLGQGSTAGVAPGSVLSSGMVLVPQGAVLELVESVVNDGIYISGGISMSTSSFSIENQCRLHPWLVQFQSKCQRFFAWGQELCSRIWFTSAVRSPRPAVRSSSSRTL